MGYIIIETNVFPNTALHQQEVDLIYDLVDQVIQRHLTLKPHFGTIILDGHTYGAAASCITHANFDGGVYTRQFFGLVDRSSTDIVADSIDQLLEWPVQNSRYERYFTEDNLSVIKGEPIPKSGIYRDGELIVMAINATYGRFIVSLKAQTDMEEECSLECELLLGAIAEIFANIGCKDPVLQAAIIDIEFKLWDHLKVDFPSSAKLLKDIIATIRQEFVSGTTEEMRTWRDWRSDLKKNGEEELFFQED